MKECPSNAMLTAFVLGYLDESELSEIADHLAECRCCEDRVGDLDTIHDPLVEKLHAAGEFSPESTTTYGESTKAASLGLTILSEEWGTFRIVRKIGQGGMGVVYEAQQVELGRRVALKFLPEHIADDPRVLLRFRREARAAARLHHTNIVPVFGISVQDGRPFLVMQYIQGRSLDHVLKESSGRLAEREAARLCLQVADALHYAHAQGVLHRDIKPSNLLLDERGSVWITDFGLAYDATDQASLTQTGDFMGTLRYTAPERFHDRGDERAEIYSLGATLYELVCGQPAYAETNRASLVHQILHQSPPRPTAAVPGMSRDLETIILKATAREPVRRYSTAEAMGEDLRRFLDDRSILARRASTLEQASRWARRNPIIAGLAALLSAVLVFVSVASLIVAREMTSRADAAKAAVVAESKAKANAVSSQKAAEAAQAVAARAEAAAIADSYIATLNEVRAIRLGHRPGWLASSLLKLVGLSKMPTPRRDLLELRSEALEVLEGTDLVEECRIGDSESWTFNLEFSRDGRILAVANSAGLSLWDVPSRRRIASLTGEEFRHPMDDTYHYRNIRFQFLKNGTLASTTGNHRVVFLDRNGKSSDRRPIIRENVQPWDLSVDREGRLIAIAWSDGRVTLHDLETNALIREITDTSRVCTLSPDGAHLALYSNEELVVFPTNKDGSPTTIAHPLNTLEKIQFSPDGQTIGATTFHRTAILYDVRSKRDPITLAGHKWSMASLAFSPDSELVATTSRDQTTRVWDARTGQLVTMLSLSFETGGLAFSPEGNRLAFSVIHGPSPVAAYQLRTHSAYRGLRRHETMSKTLSFDPTSDRLISCGYSTDLIAWNIAEAKELYRTRGEGIGIGAGIDQIAFHPGGSYFAGGNQNNAKDGQTAALYEAATGRRLRVLKGTGNASRSLEFDRAGKFLAAGGVDGSICVWDMETHKLIRREVVSQSEIDSIGFFEHERKLIVLTSEHVALIDLDGKHPTQNIRPPGYSGGVGCVDNIRDRLLIGDDDGTISVFSLPDLNQIFRREPTQDPIKAVAISPDGLIFAIGSKNGQVSVFDNYKLTRILDLPKWTGAVENLAFDRSSQKLAVAGTDSEVGLWDLQRIHTELSEIGLAWDQMPPPTVPKDDSSTSIR